MVGYSTKKLISAVTLEPPLAGAVKGITLTNLGSIFDGAGVVIVGAGVVVGPGAVVVEAGVKVLE